MDNWLTGLIVGLAIGCIVTVGAIHVMGEACLAAKSAATSRVTVGERP